MSDESIALCDVCHRWVKRSTLRMMPHERLMLPSANYLLWSEYNTSGLSPYWACDCDDLGKISLGVNGEARVKVNEDNSLTYLNCAQTFLGSGTARTQVGVNALAWNNICFWGNAGPHERDSHQNFTLVAGLCNTAGDVFQAVYSKTMIGPQRFWFSTPIADVSPLLDASEVCFYINMTTNNAACWWWFEECAANDLTEPGIFLRTKGSAVSYLTDSALRVVGKTCPACREKVFKKSELRGRPRKETDPQIPYDVWEG